MPMCSGSLSSLSGWGEMCKPAVPAVGPPEGKGILELCSARESFKTAGSTAASLGAQSQKKTQEVISKIPRTAAYEIFPGVTNFFSIVPCPIFLHPHSCGT